jgi:hypothetical protein
MADLTDDIENVNTTVDAVSLFYLALLHFFFGKKKKKTNDIQITRKFFNSICVVII